MQKLFNAGVIKVQYPIWVTNVVMVLKMNGKMRMCIDFTELNKACPKDPYPLPRIDILICRLQNVKPPGLFLRISPCLDAKIRRR